jgi:hypothetical protein
MENPIQTMIFWSLCAFIWFKNIEKMLLQMTRGFLQLESTIPMLLIIQQVVVSTMDHVYMQ